MAVPPHNLQRTRALVQVTSPPQRRNSVDSPESRKKAIFISPGYERAIFRSQPPLRLFYSDASATPPNQPVSFLGKEHEHALQIRTAACAALAAVNSADPLFHLSPVRKGASTTALRTGEAGERLIDALTLPFEEVQATFSGHRLNPLFLLLWRSRDLHLGRDTSLSLWRSATGDQAGALAAALNDLVTQLRTDWSSSPFKKELDTARRRRDKRWRSAKKAIEESLEDCGKVLAVRLDLYFREHISAAALSNFSKTAAYASLVKLQRYMRERLPLVRYMRVMEYGPETGLQVHLLALLNGHMVHNDVAIAQQLGQYWDGPASRSAGAHVSFHGAGACPGLGLIHFRAVETIDALCNRIVAPITKTGFWLHYDAPVRGLVVSQREGGSPRS